MARPPAGPPPVANSAVAIRDAKLLEIRERNYNTLAHELRKENRRADLRAMLGSDEAVERFIAVVLHSFTTNGKLLAEADPLSVFQAVRDAASMGLEPTGIGGEGWILVYGSTATFIPGWQGYLKRIRNSNAVKHVTTDVVFTNDEFDYGRDADRGFWYTHHPARYVPGDSGGNEDQTRGNYWGAYAHAVLDTGISDGEVMDYLQIQQLARQFSASVKAGKESPWTTSWGEMARKTVLKRLAKRLPQEAVADLLAADERAAKLEEETYGKDSAEARVLDTSKARRAALAALSAQRGEPTLIAPPRTPAEGMEATGSVPQAPVGEDEWLAGPPPPQTVSDDDLPETEEPS